ncbi:unnamed protein product [Linum tenue]|uniref:Uncharacterized protein n=1 Tax=Linum tenue TaxID=586396 RepID=A0AAV0JGB7_9ROSI|nr:unnamed protein product [Linum tenue]
MNGVSGEQFTGLMRM